MDSWLNEKQQALSDFMSKISEEVWYADRMDDLEYVLWYITAGCNAVSKTTVAYALPLNCREFVNTGEIELAQS